MEHDQEMISNEAAMSKAVDSLDPALKEYLKGLLDQQVREQVSQLEAGFTREMEVYEQQKQAYHSEVLKLRSKLGNSAIGTGSVLSSTGTTAVDPSTQQLAIADQTRASMHSEGPSPNRDHASKGKQPARRFVRNPRPASPKSRSHTPRPATSTSRSRTPRQLTPTRNSNSPRITSPSKRNVTTSTHKRKASGAERKPGAKRSEHQMRKGDKPEDAGPLKDDLMLHIRILYNMLDSDLPPPTPTPEALREFNSGFTTEESVDAVLQEEEVRVLIPPSSVSITPASSLKPGSKIAFNYAKVEEHIILYMKTCIARFGIRVWCPDLRQTPSSHTML
ncbi:hypothetical protein BDQ17DRAFT_651230 [Cyathus striatus]|nr:hypothetical protein BDQ17DRAFT_651230 [Cyathus striatus]